MVNDYLGIAEHPYTQLQAKETLVKKTHSQRLLQKDGIAFYHPQYRFTKEILLPKTPKFPLASSTESRTSKQSDQPTHSNRVQPPISSRPSRQRVLSKDAGEQTLSRDPGLSKSPQSQLESQLQLQSKLESKFESQRPWQSWQSWQWGVISGTAAESQMLEETLLPHIGLLPKAALQLYRDTPPLPVRLFYQNHSSRVCVMRHETDLSYPSDHHAACFPQADGILTTLKRAAFVIRTADCIPLFFIYPSQTSSTHPSQTSSTHPSQTSSAHPPQTVWGGLHVSWRSLKAGILEHTFLSLLSFQDMLASIPASLRLREMHFMLGPSIQACCYPVRADLIALLAPVFSAYGLVTHDFYKRFSGSSQVHLDLPGLCTAILIHMGARKKNIVRSKLCTACSGEFFSHRRGGTSYRNWNIVYCL